MGVLKQRSGGEMPEAPRLVENPQSNDTQDPAVGNDLHVSVDDLGTTGSELTEYPDVSRPTPQGKQGKPLDAKDES